MQHECLLNHKRTSTYLFVSTAGERYTVFLNFHAALFFFFSYTSSWRWLRYTLFFFIHFDHLSVFFCWIDKQALEDQYTSRHYLGEHGVNQYPHVGSTFDIWTHCKNSFCQHSLIPLSVFCWRVDIKEPSCNWVLFESIVCKILLAELHLTVLCVHVKYFTIIQETFDLFWLSFGWGD